MTAFLVWITDALASMHEFMPPFEVTSTEMRPSPSKGFARVVGAELGERHYSTRAV